jgi:hypothetical protein
MDILNLKRYDVYDGGIAEALKPSHNSSMLEIALILREHLLSEIFVGQSKQVEHLNAVIAQLSARPPAKS